MRVDRQGQRHRRSLQQVGEGSKAGVRGSDEPHGLAAGRHRAGCCRSPRTPPRSVAACLAWSAGTAEKAVENGRSGCALPADSLSAAAFAATFLRRRFSAASRLRASSCSAARQGEAPPREHAANRRGGAQRCAMHLNPTALAAQCCAAATPAALRACSCAKVLAPPPPPTPSGSASGSFQPPSPPPRPAPGAGTLAPAVEGPSVCLRTAFLVAPMLGSCCFFGAAALGAAAGGGSAKLLTGLIRSPPAGTWSAG